MLIGLRAKNQNLIPDLVKTTPDFWHQDYYQYLFHNNWFLVPNWKDKVQIKTVVNSYQDPLKKYLNLLPNDKQIVVFNEVFRSDAGLFSTALRQDLTLEKIEEIFAFVKANCENKCSITEHRLGTLFLVRQKWFLKILEKCDRYIDSVGLQLWLQPSSRLYNFQKEVSFELIKSIQNMGFEVFISESAIFEKDQQKQADILDKLLERLKEANVTRFTYWYLKDSTKLAQPYRDCSLGPGLLDENGNPKLAWEVIKKYAQSVNLMKK